jgi:hypothetical protein
MQYEEIYDRFHAWECVKGPTNARRKSLEGNEEDLEKRSEEEKTRRGGGGGGGVPDHH